MRSFQFCIARCRVDYKHVRYRHATRDGLQRFISHFDFESRTELTNQFFGVCPRVADEGRSDLAWQIRIVRCLWADIDNCDVAEAIGGDHTTDLTRLLRVPGTYNRKDQRNGRQPMLCEFIECDASRSYALSAFAMFQKPSETTRRQHNIDAMPLPTVRKLSASKTDKLSECIAVCAIAREGTRSQADFAMCCNAIRSGFAPDEVWQQVESVGNFAEAGRPYFDRTWTNAQHDVRTSIYEKRERRADKATERPTIDTDAFSEPDADRIAGVLADNERTLDELRHDVQLLAKRRKLRNDMDAAPPLESERLKVEQLMVDGEKQLEAIIETHRQRMSPLYALRFDLNQIRKIAQQAQDDLRSSCEDREILARFESVNEELTELTNEQGKIQADIKQMKIWMDGDRHESKITAFASEAMRFTERADDYEAKIAGLQEKLPALNTRIDELSRQLNQIELELLEP